MRTREVPSINCVFAVLESPTGTRRDARRELLFQLESVLPQPLDSVHAVFVDLAGRTLACACDRAIVEEFRATTDRLVPDTVPEWTGVGDQEQIRNRLNLLSGEMRPLSSIRRSRSTIKTLCACCILIMALLALGVSRRIERINQRQEAVNQQIAQVYQQVLPRARLQGAQPEMVRFATLLNMARSTRTGASVSDRPDLVSELSDLLTHWPKIEGLQVQSIVVRPGTTRLLLTSPDNERSTELMKSLLSMPGWESKSRSLTPRGDRVEINAVLTRTSERMTE